MMPSSIRKIKIKELLLLAMCLLQMSCSQPLGDKGLNPIEAKLIHTINPKPLLDTIREDEKCCNTQQHPIGRAVLNVVEKITSSAANVVQLPQQKYNKATRGVTQFLDQIGAKLVGLQKK